MMHEGLRRVVDSPTARETRRRSHARTVRAASILCAIGASSMKMNRHALCRGTQIQCSAACQSLAHVCQKSAPDGPDDRPVGKKA